MSFPSITFNEILLQPLQWLLECDNVGDFYNSRLPAVLKPGWSMVVNMPKSGITTSNTVTISNVSASCPVQVTQQVVQEQYNTFIALLGLNSKLYQPCKPDMFLWLINNLFEYVRCRVVRYTHTYSQDTAKMIYVNSVSLNVPFYPTTQYIPNSLLIKKDIVFSIFTSLMTDINAKFSNYIPVKEVQVSYAFVHSGEW